MATAQKIQSVADIEVVDSDFHISEKQSDFLPYLEEPFDTMLNADVEESKNLAGGKSFYPSVGWVTPMDTGKVSDHAVTNPEEVREGMEMVNADHVHLTPGLNLFLSCVAHDDLAPALAHAYNEYVLDQFVDEADGVHTSVVVAPHDPEKAAEEIDDRAGESGVSGVLLAIGGVNPMLGHRQYDPIYQACEDNDLPLVLHNAVSALPKAFPGKNLSTNRFLTGHVAVHPSDYMFHLSSMLTHGVPEKFRGLNIVVQESGVGWIPYWMHRYTDEYKRNRQDAPMLTKPPIEYIRDQFYFTSQPMEGTEDPEYLPQIIRLFGGEQNLMFSSDFPHFDFDQSTAVFDALRSEFDDDELRNIFGGTAKRVFDI